MHSALVIVQKPQDADSDLPRHQSAARRWSDYWNSERALVQNHPNAVEALGEGCLLITLEEGADPLADALDAAKRAGLSYRVLFFKKPPQWVRSARADGAAKK